LLVASTQGRENESLSSIAQDSKLKKSPLSRFEQDKFEHLHESQLVGWQILKKSFLGEGAGMPVFFSLTKSWTFSFDILFWKEFSQFGQCFHRCVINQ